MDGLGGIEVSYTLDGCRGALVRRERSASVRPIVLASTVMAFVASVAAAFVFGAVEPLVVPFFIIALLVGSRPDDGGSNVDVGWLREIGFARVTVRREFAVEAGILTFDAPDGPQSCLLAGASVERAFSGVRVVPALGDVIHLWWDHPEEADLDTLASTLEAAAARAGPAEQRDEDVPDALRALKGPVPNG